MLRRIFTHTCACMSKIRNNKGRMYYNIYSPMSTTSITSIPSSKNIRPNVKLVHNNYRMYSSGTTFNNKSSNNTYAIEENVSMHSEFEEDDYEDNLLFDSAESEERISHDSGDMLIRKIETTGTFNDLVNFCNGRFHLLTTQHIIIILQKILSLCNDGEDDAAVEKEEFIDKLIKRASLQAFKMHPEQLIKLLGLLPQYFLSAEDTYTEVLLDALLVHLTDADIEDIIHLNFLLEQYDYDELEQANRLYDSLPESLGKFIHTQELHPELLKQYCVPLTAIMMRGNDRHGVLNLLLQIYDVLHSLAQDEVHGFITMMLHPNILQLFKDTKEAAEFDEIVLSFIESLDPDVTCDIHELFQSMMVRLQTASTVLKFHPGEKYSMLLDSISEKIISDDNLTLPVLSNYLKILHPMNYITKGLVDKTTQLIMQDGDSLVTESNINIQPLIFCLTKSADINLPNKELFNALHVLMQPSIWQKLNVPLLVKLKLLITMLSVKYTPPDWFKQQFTSDHLLRLWLEDQGNRRSRRNLLLSLVDLNLLNTWHDNFHEIYNIQELVNEGKEELVKSVDFMKSTILEPTLDRIYPGCVHSNILYQDLIIDYLIVIDEKDGPLPDGDKYIHNNYDIDEDDYDYDERSTKSLQKIAILEVRSKDVILPTCTPSNFIKAKINHLTKEGFKVIWLSSSLMKKYSPTARAHYVQRILDDNLKKLE